MGGMWARLRGILILTLDFLTQRLIVARKESPVSALKESGQSLAGKVAVVTGGNSGIGVGTVEGLAAAGARVILACRSKEKGEAVVAKLPAQTSGKVDVEVLDLSSIASVRKFADRLRASLQEIHILVLNAGVMGVSYGSACDDSFSPECHLGTNHLGHFMLTMLLLPLLKKASSARIVVVGSIAMVINNLDITDLEYKTRSYNAQEAYPNSKLCNLLFAEELSLRLRDSGICVNAVHPGDVYTGIARHLSPLNRFGHKYIVGPFLLPAERGPWCTLYAAVHPDMEGVSGKFLWRVDEELPFKKKLLEDLPADTASKLWTISVNLCRFTHQESLAIP